MQSYDYQTDYPHLKSCKVSAFCSKVFQHRSQKHFEGAIMPLPCQIGVRDICKMETLVVVWLSIVGRLLLFISNHGFIFNFIEVVQMSSGQILLRTGQTLLLNLTPKLWPLHFVRRTWQTNYNSNNMIEFIGKRYLRAKVLRTRQCLQFGLFLCC